MDYGRVNLADRLACAYVTGTLRGRARRRFEALLPAHPALHLAVRAWQDRLMPLTITIEPQQPPPRVWERIQQSIDRSSPSLTSSTSTKAVASRPEAWWQSLSFWRGLTAVGAIAVVSLSVLLAMPGPAVAPVIVVLNAAAPTAPGAITPASFVVSISGDGRAMVTRPLSNVSLQADRSLELWAIQGNAPARSLGLISAQAATVVRRGQVLRGADTLAVTLEPPGGAPNGVATGPVVFVGKL